eukprot:5944735-Pyramimonas_sp.AAC.1
MSFIKQWIGWAGRARQRRASRRPVPRRRAVDGTSRPSVTIGCVAPGVCAFPRGAPREGGK